jgi:tetrahydromethanopterin S-methyltransferase subunit G
LSKQINGLVISIDRLSTRLETIEKTIIKMDNRIEKLAERIETIEHAPIKRSEKLRLGAIGSLIGAIIGAVVGYIINLL